jgi:putative glutamine amidotransferase
MKSSKPLIGVVSDRRLLETHHFHMVGEKYLRALVNAAEVYPVALPSLGEEFDILTILDHVDGIFFPGSQSNMEPHRYEGTPSKPDTWHDPERDHGVLDLIPAVVQAGIPMFAVCRGFQEMNVAFGGTLHQVVHEMPDYHMHKENPDDPLDVQYGPSHEVTFTPGGLLESITGMKSVMVNSLHSQAVDHLADGLKVEANADDGLIEAFVVDNSPGFTLGVQWHPEWKVLDNETSTAIFRVFGDACRSYQTS